MTDVGRVKQTNVYPPHEYDPGEGVTSTPPHEYHPGEGVTSTPPHEYDPGSDHPEKEVRVDLNQKIKRNFRKISSHRH